MSIQAIVFRNFLRYRFKNAMAADAPVAETRAFLDRMTRVASSGPPPGTAARSIDVAGLRAEWIATGESPAAQVIYYLHGGGYALCSPRTHRSLVSLLAALAGADALVLDYRLAPEHPFPAAIDDAVEGYRWLLDRGFSPDQIAIAGDSAGGGLSFATLLSLRDHGVELPSCVVGLSPWLDLTMAGESMQRCVAIDPMLTPDGVAAMARRYLQGGDPTNPLASPLFADHAGLPPALIQVGSDEILLDDSRRMATALASAGVPVHLEVWDDMFHVWHAFAGRLPEARRALAGVAAFMRAHWR